MTGSTSSFQKTKSEKLFPNFGTHKIRKTGISNAEIKSGEQENSTGEQQNGENQRHNRDMGASADQPCISTLIKYLRVQGKNNRTKKSMVASKLSEKLETNPLTKTATAANS